MTISYITHHPHSSYNVLVQWNLQVKESLGNGSPYTKLKFSPSMCYAKLSQETVHLMRLILRNYDEIISLLEQLKKLFLIK
jgi:hypothetical protein